jgi:NhaP-type Na+/H+ and K+/H+ antiporter
MCEIGGYVVAALWTVFFILILPSVVLFVFNMYSRRLLARTGLPALGLFVICLMATGAHSGCG